MKKLLTILATLVALTFGSLAVAGPAVSNEPNVGQLCVDFADTGEFLPHLAEDYATWEAMRGHRVAGFVNSPAGCAGLAPDAGEVWDGVNPFPAPPAPPTCEAEVITIVDEVEVVHTVTDPSLPRKVERQRATIQLLRAKIRALR